HAVAETCDVVRQRPVAIYLQGVYDRSCRPAFEQALRLLGSPAKGMRMGRNACAVGDTETRRRGKMVRRLGLVCMAVAVGASVSSLPAEATGPTMITTCTQSAVKAAIANGGTVEFAQSCDVPLTSALTLTNRNVDLEGNGFSVILDGQSSTRIMSIK